MFCIVFRVNDYKSEKQFLSWNIFFFVRQNFFVPKFFLFLGNIFFCRKVFPFFITIINFFPKCILAKLLSRAPSFCISTPIKLSLSWDSTPGNKKKFARIGAHLFFGLLRPVVMAIKLDQTLKNSTAVQTMFIILYTLKSY